jgi:hypothetical protein
MNSIYQHAMGSDFAKLHPRIQERFGFDSTAPYGLVGKGVMEEVLHGAPYTLPFLYVGTWRRIMFPEYGRNIPFRIENYAFVDPMGRETVTWVRTFETRRARRFDAYMIYSQQRGCIVDYLGTHQHLAVDLELSVDAEGGMRLRSAEQRFYEGLLGFRFPQFFSGIADVREWYDDQAQCFRITVTVTNGIWGRLFGYRGRFQSQRVSCDAGKLPAHLQPARFESRE